ncbi:two-component sensor histidine kinase [Cystobacter fuscus]|uniref:histidine kinase n=1 Tax=Cystobacter fuscus TaxID=43 RepID=A0A250JKW2_9BACT|nr:ATP-binding protein [Cystobacter fuscus]ATB44270.1 two-component sensor histidine kinase [Cystobacter fuscus]
MSAEDEAPEKAAAPETTIAELLALVARMAAQQPHAPMHVGSGPLAPLAVALNDLSARLEARRTKKTEDVFGIQTLIAQSPNIMFACDAEARIRFLNYTLPLHTPEMAMGTLLYSWFEPYMVERVRGIIEKVLTTGERYAFEIPPSLHTGAEWYMARVAPIRMGQQLVGFTVILTDISELKHSQLSLERSNRELESFAYVASHDLQEPLRKIQTFGERLVKTSATTLSPEGRDYVDRMQGAATRMRRLIDDLLAFSRVSSKTRPFSQVDLAVVAREVLADLESAIEQAGATVTLEALPVLEADATQMRQLLQNLVGNALKFRREGVPPVISVRGTVDPRSQRCELVVEDNGIGFEEKFADRIFNVFQRLHGRGQYEGTGIGLAICRKIAERHGGSIRARSTPGEGAAFLVSLPLKQLMRQ